MAVSDIVYLVFLGGMVAGRWLEFQTGHAQKGTGEPATPADVYRYLLLAPLIGLAVWAAANAIGNGGL
jgi:hypothetical protein